MASVSSPMIVNGEETEEQLNNEEGEKEEEEISTPKKPKDGNASFLGMLFDSIQAAEDDYQDFGDLNGFSIRRRTTYSSSSGAKNGVLFVCACEGKHKPQKSGDSDVVKQSKCTSTVKTQCSARMRIKWCQSKNGWVCSVFHNVHNHGMVSPDKRNLMRSRRIMPESAKDFAVTFNKRNIRVGKVAELYGKDATFGKRDVWNHMKWFRKINYENNDAEGVKKYFVEMAAKDPLFFYAIQCDDEGRAANFFWADAQSREAYRQFGDVVAFDTTYRTNKYCMPFAPFTGVNHHRQSILFGCALLENEQEYTFTWLFQTWLQAMDGKAPISILTDQDVAMGNAIARVFPHTRHRLCLWHIKKKFGEKLGQVYAKRSNFKRAVKKCTRGARSIQDFEDQWACLIQKYGLEDHSWLNDMYDIRSSWIPIYCRDTFFAGMNTTQRSESINSFFNDYVNSSTSLVDFVTKYEYALESIRTAERQEDHESRNKTRVLKNKDPILAHASEIYTRNMFKIVAEEVEEVIALQVEPRSVDGDIYTLLIQYKVGNSEEWIVTFNLTTKMGSCDCQLFEFLGVPCKHLMKLFDHFHIYQIPTHFIMNRWCKYANRSTLFESNVLSIKTSDCEVVARGARVSELCKLAYQLAHECGESEIMYKKFKDVMFKLSVDAREINDIMLQQENNEKLNIDGQENKMDTLTSEQSVIGTAASRVDALLLEPNVSQTKGRKKTINQENDSQVDKRGKGGRWKGGMEKVTGRKKPRLCKSCHNTMPPIPHDSRNCPKNQIAKAKQIHNMECEDDDTEDFE